MDWANCCRFEWQPNCRTSSVKVHREKSGTFSQKVSAKLPGVLPQDPTAVSTQQRWLELQKFSSSTLFSCLQLCTKYTKEVTLWVTFFQLMWESERSTQKWIMQRQDSAEQGKDQKMCSKSEKRISVTFSDCFSIPDAPGSKSSLSKKYIFPLSLCICTWWHWTIFLSRSQEELLEQLTVSLGHVECRHAHYPATPPVYRSEEDH